MFVCIPDSPFFSFSFPFFFHAVPMSYLTDGLDKGHLPNLQSPVLVFQDESLICRSQMFEENMDKKEVWKTKQCMLYRISVLSNRTLVSMVVVFDTVWLVSFCCGYNICRFCFFSVMKWFWKTQSLFYLWFFGNEVQLLTPVWPRYTP